MAGAWGGEPNPNPIFNPLQARDEEVKAAESRRAEREREKITAAEGHYQLLLEASSMLLRASMASVSSLSLSPLSSLLSSFPLSLSPLSLPLVLSSSSSRGQVDVSDTYIRLVRYGTVWYGMVRT